MSPFSKNIYIDFREIGREIERETETLIGCFPYTPDHGSNPQPGYVP